MKRQELCLISEIYCPQVILALISPVNTSSSPGNHYTPVTDVFLENQVNEEIMAEIFTSGCPYHHKKKM